jgi:hypothetical protein
MSSRFKWTKNWGEGTKGMYKRFSHSVFWLIIISVLVLGEVVI